jgi:hypothetical protein
LDDQQMSATRLESRPLSSAIAGVGLVDAAALAGRPLRARAALLRARSLSGGSGSELDWSPNRTVLKLPWG